MTDDLVKRLRDGRTLGCGECRDAINEAADRIEALTAERDSLLSGHRVLNIDGARLQDRAEAAEADNARLLGVVQAAVDLIEGDLTGLKWKYACWAFCVKARAALTGKEPT